MTNNKPGMIKIVTMPNLEHLIIRRSKMEWIKCSDRMPSKDGKYLIHSHAGNIVTRQYYTHHDDAFFGRVVATHWMALPPPPKLK